jgi:hypothetical protein
MRSKSKPPYVIHLLSTRSFSLDGRNYISNPLLIFDSNRYFNYLPMWHAQCLHQVTVVSNFVARRSFFLQRLPAHGLQAAGAIENRGYESGGTLTGDVKGDQLYDERC